MKHNCKNGFCASSGKCPNVTPYKDGSNRGFHSSVRCTKCGNEWMWGLSWDGSMDDKFVCRDCEDVEDHDCHAGPESGCNHESHTQL